MIRLWWIIQKYSVHVGVESGCYLDLLKLTTAAEKSIDTNLQKKHHAHPQTLKLALVNPVFIELNAVVEKELQIKQIKVVSEKLIQIWDIKCKDKNFLSSHDKCIKRWKQPSFIVTFSSVEQWLPTTPTGINKVPGYLSNPPCIVSIIHRVL